MLLGARLNSTDAAADVADAELDEYRGPKVDADADADAGSRCHAIHWNLAFGHSSSGFHQSVNSAVQQPSSPAISSPAVPKLSSSSQTKPCNCHASTGVAYIEANPGDMLANPGCLGRRLGIIRAISPKLVEGRGGGCTRSAAGSFIVRG
jgi:hypothetical protein